jgi:hypothetical protein
MHISLCSVMYGGMVETLTREQPTTRRSMASARMRRGRDLSYMIDRLRSDLRTEIYELMTHVGYHTLEKQLTESVLIANPLYSSIRRFTLDPNVPQEEKTARKELFAYTIYRAMNATLGGFHFDRYRSLCTGALQYQRMSEIIRTFSFDEFLANYEGYVYLRGEPDWQPFVESKQFRHLEDAITSSLKKNTVIPGVSRAIAKDIVDTLKLNETYGYIRVSDRLLEKEFEPPEGHEFGDYVSLRKTPIVVGNEQCYVLLKRTSRVSSTFKLLATNFGALIKGR